jgi:hypothetical protein
MMPIIHDGGTDREMTEQEIVAAELTKAQAIASAKAEANVVADKAKAKQAVLDKLGLTADEVTALLG